MVWGICTLGKIHKAYAYTGLSDAHLQVGDWESGLDFFLAKQLQFSVVGQPVSPKVSNYVVFAATLA